MHQEKSRHLDGPAENDPKLKINPRKHQPPAYRPARINLQRLSLPLPFNAIRRRHRFFRHAPRNRTLQSLVKLLLHGVLDSLRSGASFA